MRLESRSSSTFLTRTRVKIRFVSSAATFRETTRARAVNTYDARMMMIFHPRPSSKGSNIFWDDYAGLSLEEFMRKSFFLRGMACVWRGVCVCVYGSGENFGM